MHHALQQSEIPHLLKSGLDMQEHLARIVPEAAVDAQTAMFTAEAADSLLSGDLDFVLDAIDNIDTKVHSMSACHSISASL